MGKMQIRTNITLVNVYEFIKCIEISPEKHFNFWIPFHNNNEKLHSWNVKVWRHSHSVLPWFRLFSDWYQYRITDKTSSSNSG